MKLTKDIMRATGETIAVCEQLDVDPRLVARVLLGVIDWASSEPPLEQAPPPAPWTVDVEELQAPPALRTLFANGDERDEKGRKIIRRDHNWRENTLKHVAVGAETTIEQLLQQLEGVSKGALTARLRTLSEEGVLAELAGGQWRRLK